MATINLTLDERARKNGECPVRLRICNKGSIAYVATGVSTRPEVFDSKNTREPIRKQPQKCAVISALVRRFDDAVMKLQIEEPGRLATMSATDIRALVIGESKKGETGQKSKFGINSEQRRNKFGTNSEGGGDFLGWLDEYGQGRKTEKTKSSYGYVWRLLAEYCGARTLKGITFEDLDYPMLVDIKGWLRATGRGESTRHMVESYMHAAWREARRMRIATGEDPWLYYRIEPCRRNGMIEYADETELRALLGYDTKGRSGEKWLEEAKDIVRLSWYFCGANLIDIYNMPAPKHGRFAYVRHKLQTRTSEPVVLQVEPEVEALMRKYPGRNGLAFGFASDVPTWETFQRKVNDRLKRLNELSGTSVSLASVRRSWATYALHEGWQERVVDRSMGHMASGILNRHYGAYMWEDTARCNRAMIDWLTKQAA